MRYPLRCASAALLATALAGCATSTPAAIGSDGLTAHPSESLSATPIGSFTLTQAFGRNANPGTALPYLRTTPDDWWISQPGPRIVPGAGSGFFLHVTVGASTQGCVAIPVGDLLPLMRWLNPAAAPRIVIGIG